MTCPTSWRSWALLARSSRSQAADVGGQAAQLGAQDLLGDRLAGVRPQAAASARLPGCAQPAQRLPQVIGRAEQQRLERVHRGGAGGAGLGAGGEQDPQPLPGTIRSWLGELVRGQGVAGGPQRISRVRLATRPLAGPGRAPGLDHHLPTGP